MYLESFLWFCNLDGLNEKIGRYVPLKTLDGIVGGKPTFLKISGQCE